MFKGTTRKIIFLFLCVLYCGCSNTSLVPKESKKHFLWKVSDSDSYVWILGSIHMAESSFYPLNSVITNAFNESESLVLEIDLSDDSIKNESTSLSMELGVLPTDQLLKDILPDTTYSQLDSLVRSWGLSMDLFKTFKPWMIAMQISAIAIESTGFSSEWGIESFLMDQAVLSGKGIISLESPATQINAIANSDTLGVFYLEETLKEIAQIKNLLFQVAVAWQEGNSPKLRSLLNPDDKSKNENEKEMEAMLNKKIYTDRNKGMVNQIEQFLRNNKKHFIAVGVAHLIEEDNVIQSLEKKGFKVESY